MNNNTLCLISAMDRLWYHQIILCSDPLSSSHVPNSETFTTHPFTKFPSCPSSSSTLPFPPLTDEDQTLSLSSDDSTSVHSQEDCSNVTDEDKQEGDNKERQELLPTRILNLSSSFSTQKTPKRVRFSVGRRLSKSMSCRGLGELELEEVKGFMDLGFVFKKENLSSQMVNLLPGLQRLRTHRKKQKLPEEEEEEEEEEEDDDDEDEERVVSISRPYLSEAWTIKRPNSPLLNLRIPKFSSTTEMKKHLKFWAKTVASEIHEES